MHLFYTPDITTNNELPKEEAAHCTRVLRLSEGDQIELTDGNGFFYKAEITNATNKRCYVSIVEKEEQEKQWKGHIHLAMAPTKNMDRIEWFAEKATEIGFDELSFLNCRYSERKVVKSERINKILVSAMKQSLKARLPQQNELVKFKSFIEKPFDGDKYIAHCYDDNEIDEKVTKEKLKELLQPGHNSLVLIGPEGDFSVEEVKLALANGYKPISLGNTRLRTETAALVAVHLMNLSNQE